MDGSIIVLEFNFLCFCHNESIQSLRILCLYQWLPFDYSNDLSVRKSVSREIWFCWWCWSAHWLKHCVQFIILLSTGKSGSQKTWNCGRLHRPSVRAKATLKYTRRLRSNWHWHANINATIRFFFLVHKIFLWVGIIYQPFTYKLASHNGFIAIGGCWFVRYLNYI